MSTKPDDSDNKQPCRWQLPAIGDVDDIVTMQTSISKIKEEIAKQAKNEGIEQGREQGYKAGLLQAQSEINDLKKQLHQLIDLLAKPLQIVNVEFEKLILQLCKKISEHIIYQELKTSPDIYLTMVQQALVNLENHVEQYTIEMNQQDYEQLLDHLGLEVLSSYQIIVSKEAPFGACTIKNESITINASIETRLNEIMKTLQVTHE